MPKKLINIYGETEPGAFEKDAMECQLWRSEQKRIEGLIEVFQKVFGEYWKYVKDSVDFEGWVYTKEVNHLLDAYFEHNTGQPIEFQRTYEGEYNGSRWRPKVLS